MRTIWYVHKPRVLRLRLRRTLVTVSPDMTRRGWLWAVDRLSGAVRNEHAHGRCRRRCDAMMISLRVAREYDEIFCAENEARIMRG